MRLKLLVIVGLFGLWSVHGAVAGPEDEISRNWQSYRTTGPLTSAERNAPWVRSTEASGQVDAFCAAWDDGCEACTREVGRWPGEKFCKPLVPEGAACVRTPVRCTEYSPHQSRVCLSYSDGCNTFNNATGGQTAVFCGAKGSGRMPANYFCTTPRQPSVAAYPEAIEVAMDLAGTWWLVGRRGESCLITLSADALDGARIAGGCAPRLARILRLQPTAVGGDATGRGCSISITGEKLMVRCGEDDGARDRRRTTLAFSLHDLDFPVGIGASKGYRLLRVATP